MFAGDLFNPLRRKKMIVPFMIGERSGVVKRVDPGSRTLPARPGTRCASIESTLILDRSLTVRETSSKDREENFCALKRIDRLREAML
jgi:hypothetical protein